MHNKTLVLPYVDFNIPYFRQGIELLNPDAAFFPLSCKTGEGFAEWIAWLRTQVAYG